MKPGKTVLAFAMVACTLPALVLAQETVKGVKWRATTSMQSKSMNMPARTAEVCMPATDADQAAIHQGEQQQNCKMTSIKRSGGKTVADMQCTGERSSSTHIEIEKNGDTMHSTMTMKTASTTINTTSDYTKIGSACDIPKDPAQAALSQGTLEERKKRLQEMMGGGK